MASIRYNAINRESDFYAAGDRQAQRLAKYRQQWEQPEDRERQRQQEQAKAQQIELDNTPSLSH
jgi:hypothetical protein